MPRLTTTFGRTWWSQRWLRPLDELGIEFDGRLTRGRTLARDGGVLQTHVDAGAVLATVKGSYWEQYAVTVELPVLDDAVWERVIVELAREALHLATLLANAMPAEIEAVFARAAAPLFPEMEELIADCACADGVRPCKHILATMYSMATRLDKDPLLLFLLRGRSRETLIAALYARWSGEESDERSVRMDDASGGLRAARYFTQAPILDDFTVGYEAPTEDAVILRRLGQPPFAREDEDVVAALTPVYVAVTRHALKAAARHTSRSSHARGSLRSSSSGDGARRAEEP
jgi:uncharacterized Zn finger protein